MDSNDAQCTVTGAQDEGVPCGAGHATPCRDDARAGASEPDGRGPAESTRWREPALRLLEGEFSDGGTVRAYAEFGEIRFARADDVEVSSLDEVEPVAAEQ